MPISHIKHLESNPKMNSSRSGGAQLALIAAIGENGELGKNNELLWHLPHDFKRFKKRTIGHSIIMGRKTFESFKKPLPQRKHIIITRSKKYTINNPECYVVHSEQEALQLVKQETLAYCIGGGEIYTLMMPYADLLDLTQVHHTFDDADTYFPDFEEKDWRLEYEKYNSADSTHAYAFTFLTYVRK